MSTDDENQPRDAVPHELADTLRGWSFGDEMTPLVKAIEGGSRGAQILASEIRSRKGWDQIYFVSALGDADRSVGDSVLHEVLTGQLSSNIDVRCMSLVALAKRKGMGATTTFELGLADKNRSVQLYSMMCLAVFGDDSAWESAFQVWKKWIQRPSTKRDVNLPDELVGLTYLLRDIDKEPDRQRQLARFLIDYEPRLRLPTRTTLRNFWPGLLVRTDELRERFPEHNLVVEWIQTRVVPHFASFPEIYMY